MDYLYKNKYIKQKLDFINKICYGKEEIMVIVRNKEVKKVLYSICKYIVK